MRDCDLKLPDFAFYKGCFSDGKEMYKKAGCTFRVIACSKRSDSGERCEVKKAMKSRGGLGREVHLSPSLAFIFLRSFLLRTAPHYLNAWNRLSELLFC